MLLTLEYTQDMGYSRVEFDRQIQRVLPAENIHLRPDGAVLYIGTGQLHIDLGPEQERRIANIRLPRMQVRFRFYDLHEPELSAFRTKFDLYFQKGGG